jgi:ketosteroid isomerase-like protein
VTVSERTIDQLRDFYARWTDEEYVKAATSLFDPEVELIQPSELPGAGGVYRGYEGLLRALSENLEGFEYLHAEAERFDLGDDTVVATVRLRAKGRKTGIDLDARVGHLFVFRGERAIRWEVYWSPEEALEAAGLAG